MFLVGHYDTTIRAQKEIEKTFLESEQSLSCPKPPKKKRKLTATKKKDVAQNAMTTLAAQLQVDHYRKVSHSALMP